MDNNKKQEILKCMLKFNVPSLLVSIPVLLCFEQKNNFLYYWVLINSISLIFAIFKMRKK